MTLIKKPTPRPSVAGPEQKKKTVSAPAPQLRKQLTSFKKDELSTGRGGQLRRRASQLLGDSSSLKPASFAIAQAVAPQSQGPVGNPQVRAATAAVTAAWNSSSDPQTRDKAVAKAIEENAKLFAKDPALALEFANGIAPTVTKLAADLGQHKNEKWIKGVLGTLAKASDTLGGPATVQLGAAVAKGLPDTDNLYYVDDALNSNLGLAALGALTEQGKLTAAKDLNKTLAPFIGVLVGGLVGFDPFLRAQVLKGVPQEVFAQLALAQQKLGNTDLAKLFSSTALLGLDAIRETAQKANDTLAVLTAELNAQLVHVPDDLKNAYQQEYWAEHADAQKAADDANAALHQALEAQLPILTQLAATNPAVAKALAATLTELARNPSQAQFVTDTIDALAKNGAFPPGFEKVEKTLIEARSMAAQALSQGCLARGDSVGARDVLQGTLDFLEDVKFVSTDALEIVKEQLPALRSFTETASKAVSSGDYSLISKYLLDKDNAEELASIVKTNPALGNLIAGTSLALFVIDAATAKDGTTQVLAILNAGGPASELLASGLATLGKITGSKALVGAGETVAVAGEVLGRITGGIGVVIGALQTFKDLGGAFSDPGLESVTTAITSTLTTIGGAVALFPGGQLIGAGLISLGVLVSGFTALFEEDPFEKTANEIEKVLGKVFGTLANDPSSPLSKLTPEERKELAKRLANSQIEIDSFVKAGDLTLAQFIDVALHTDVLSQVFDSTIASEVISASGLRGAALVKWLIALSPTIGNLIDNIGHAATARQAAEEARIDAYDAAKDAGLSDADAKAAGEAARLKKLNEELKKELLEQLKTSTEYGEISPQYSPPRFGIP